MKKILASIALTLFATLSCGKEEAKVNTHTAARQAAERYFSLLMEEKYDSLVDFIYVSDSLPSDYHSQLADAMAQYKVSETKRRSGLAAFRITGDSIFADSVSGYARVELTFGDKSKENIILPLLCDEGTWKLR